MKYYILTSAQKDFLINAFFGMPYTQWNSKFPKGMVANSKFMFTELKLDKYGLIETVMTSENVVDFFSTFEPAKKQAVMDIITIVPLREVPADEYRNAMIP